MKNIAIYNFKGGADKTTITHTLACGLATDGQRVLVVDTDPQGHLALLFNVSPEPRFYDYLARADRTQFADAAISIPRSQYAPNASHNNGAVTLIPGDDETSLLPLRVKDPLLLRKRLNAVAGHFDYCLIDTPPTPSLLSVVINCAVDAMIFPTKCENLHIDGLTRALAARYDAREYRQGLPEIQVLGIQPSIFRAKTLEHQEYHAWLIENYGESLVWSPLSESILWPEATRARLPIMAYAPRSKAAREAWKMVRRFQKEVVL